MEVEHNNRLSVDDVMNLSRGGHNASHVTMPLDIFS